MSLCHTMHLCHTMSQQATLTSTTPRPGNQGFIMSPMSPHVTMSHHAPVPAWQCHTMSHQATLTSNTTRPETKVLSCHQATHVTMSHHAPVPHMSQQCHPDIDTPRPGNQGFIMSPMSHVTPCTMCTPCHTMPH